MNRMSSQTKYILKDGKYTVQQREEGELQTHRARSNAANSSECPKHSLIRTTNGNLNTFNTARQNLNTEMTSSAIYPRRIEGIPRHFESRRIGFNQAGSVEHSEAKLNDTERQPNVLHAAKQLRVAFESMRCDAKSNQSQEENYETSAGNLTTLEAQTHMDTRNLDELGPEDKVLELTAVNRELTEKLRQFQRRQLEDKYRLAPQQELVWLKRMLEDRNSEFQKIYTEKARFQNQVLFLKERVISLQRANHILQIENARNKTQLFTEEELLHILCPEESRGGSFNDKDKNIIHLQAELEDLKSQICKLEGEKSNSCDTRSEIVHTNNPHKTNPQLEKINNIKKHISERSNILDAYKYGSEKKETLKNYIRNIVERSNVEQNSVAQLKNQIRGKEAIIQQMDSLVANISEQLATCKKDLSKQFQLQDSIQEMRQSMMTAASYANEQTPKQPSSLTSSRFDGYCESPMKGLRAVRLSEDVYNSTSTSRLFDPSPDRRRPERVESQIVEDASLSLKRLQKQCIDKQRLIERYQSEVVRLNRLMGSQFGLNGQIERRLSMNEYERHQTHQTQYTSTLHEISSSLKLKKKHIGGQNSKTSIISIKRASVF